MNTSISTGRSTKIISESSSDDDIPLSSLQKSMASSVSPSSKQQQNSSTPKKNVEIVVKQDLDVTKNEVKVKLEKKNSGAIRKRDQLGSDSDDEIPLTKLIKKEKHSNGSTPKKVKKSNIKVKQEKRNSPPMKKSKKRTYFKQQECSQSLYKLDKGRLVQELLCRWWYAIEWSPTGTKYTAPSGCQELDGFPGTFIHVKGDEMGSLLDLRNNAGKPTFLNLFSKPSEELKQLVIKAYRNQIDVLVKHEGEDAPLLKELHRSMSSIEKVNTERADKKAKKVFKEWKVFKDEILHLSK